MTQLTFQDMLRDAGFPVNEFGTIHSVVGLRSPTGYSCVCHLDCIRSGLFPLNDQNNPPPFCAVHQYTLHPVVSNRAGSPSYLKCLFCAALRTPQASSHKKIGARNSADTGSQYVASAVHCTAAAEAAYIDRIKETFRSRAFQDRMRQLYEEQVAPEVQDTRVVFNNRVQIGGT